VRSASLRNRLSLHPVGGAQNRFTAGCRKLKRYALPRRSCSSQVPAAWAFGFVYSLPNYSFQRTPVHRLRSYKRCGAGAAKFRR
jgi:hypothetical protein